MQLTKQMIAASLMLICALTVSGCAGGVSNFQTFPNASDLIAEPKEQLPIEALDSSKANAEYNRRLETWGERHCQKVSRICQWSNDLALALDLDPPQSCAPPEDNICTVGPESPPPP